MIRKVIIIALLIGLWGCGPKSTPDPEAVRSGKSKIASNVTIDGVDVGGQDMAHAKKILSEHIDREMANMKLSLTYEDKTFALDAALLRPQYALDDALYAAFAASPGEDVPLLCNLLPDRPVLEEALQGVMTELDTPPTDAKVVSFDPKKQGNERWVFTPENPGHGVDLARLLEDVEKAINERKLNDPVAIQTTDIPAKLTLAKLEASRSVVASFATNLLSTGARDKNISLCAKALSGAIVLPGQKFSINKTTGPRTRGKGYEDASTIVGGRITKEVGGGICQVAGTLYNAVLRSDLEIVERHSHSLTSLYLPPALDATLVYGSKDFVFRNNRDTPVYIESQTDISKRKLTFIIYDAPL
ncbi:MAG: VanW family protein, partial [Clostridia bacterium]|nr:VanW family protein [Clostridia bacterium]